uniref:SAC domain-containing protein n=1 Tax=Steinernema glaseri TaxID=37863 RepID=A0A1I8AK30_9BILA
MKRLVQRETNFIVNHVIDAMKKGLLRGWESSQSERIFTEDARDKMTGAILDAHKERPPTCLWYDAEQLSHVNSRRLIEALKKLEPLLVPGWHNIRVSGWIRYIC